MTKANKIYERQQKVWIEAQKATIKTSETRIKGRTEEIRLLQQMNAHEKSLNKLNKSALTEAQSELKQFYKRVK